jgi:dethiobiotin synthetase
VRGLFVTGTDTGAGKSLLSAALLAAISSAGEAVRAHKPVVTGLDAGAAEPWPPDHELLASAAGMPAEEVAPVRYGPAVSPHLAAELAGEQIELEQLLAAVQHEPSELLIVEGIGGLFTPLAENLTVCDYATALGLPVLIAARPGLGTLNHTLLTLEVARRRGLPVAGVIVNETTPVRGAAQQTNVEELRKRLDVPLLAVVAHGAMDAAELGRVDWRRLAGIM